MDSLKNSPGTPDFNTIVQELLERWRRLPQDARNNRATIEELLRYFPYLSLNARRWDILNERLNIALAQEGYTGEPLEILNYTKRLIELCCREDFIGY